VVVSKVASTTAVTSSANPSVPTQPVTFTAPVSPTVGTAVATGTVGFLDGCTQIGTGTLAGGVASFTTSSLGFGLHTITTSYAGDTGVVGSSGSLTGNPQVVNKAVAITSLTGSVNPSEVGQSVTFTATLSAVAPSVGTPTGTVDFLDGGTQIGTGTLVGGRATFTTSALAAGGHTITTSYAGDNSFNGDTGQLVGNPLTVNKDDATTALTSSVNASRFGQSVTFTATLSVVPPGAGTPTGTVKFLDGGTQIGSASLTAGAATFTTSALAAGDHTITTTYAGDNSFAGSAGSLTGNPQVVNKADASTDLTSLINASSFGQSVTSPPPSARSRPAPAPPPVPLTSSTAAPRSAPAR
jgi:hypothetical protein